MTDKKLNEAANKYRDERMENWIEKSKALVVGDGANVKTGVAVAVCAGQAFKAGAKFERERILGLLRSEMASDLPWISSGKSWANWLAKELENNVENDSPT